MILADTSAWVEYDRATGSPVDVHLTNLIAEDGPLAVTEPVTIEVLAGVRTDHHEADLRRILQRFEHLGVDIAADFHAAARVYRRCRREGVTPRGLVDISIDCMIASIALRNSASLLAHDIDMYRVAKGRGDPDGRRIPADLTTVTSPLSRTRPGPVPHGQH